MTASEIEKLLNEYTYIDDEISNCVEEMQILTELADCERDVKAIIYSGMPGNKYDTSDPTFQKALKVIENFKKEIDRIEQRQEGLFEKRAIVEKWIDILTPEERQVIRLRYFKKHRWWMIAREINYSRRQSINIRDAAVKKLEEYEQSNN